ncbi:S1 RNA-binding domain-containing protein [Anaerolineales bacterium]
MSSDLIIENVADEFDFGALLDESFASAALERGDIVTGTILAKDNQGLIVDVGWKQDGIVARQDLERMGKSIQDYTVGDDITVSVLRFDDADDNLILSASQARMDEDWQRAEQLMEADEAWEGSIAAVNRGGVISLFGNLRGFIPASHILDVPRGLNEDDRVSYLEKRVGEPIRLKVIEVNRKRRRLVFSQRHAELDNRLSRKQRVLDDLKEGDVREGIVSGLCDFGAFVDLGGVDGLIHISELAWHRVSHPSEVVNPGDKVEIYLLHVDEDGKRIGLSLKRLKPNPWTNIEETYHIGQLVEGEVTRTEPFGVFVNLAPGIEALLHVSQISDSEEPIDPRTLIQVGQKILSRVISIEAEKQRLGLSLKEVSEEELLQWHDDQQGETLVEVDV